MDRPDALLEGEVERIQERGDVGPKRLRPDPIGGRESRRGRAGQGGAATSPPSRFRTDLGIAVPRTYLLTIGVRR
jgi:hypothetical protein